MGRKKQEWANRPKQPWLQYVTTTDGRRVQNRAYNPNHPKSTGKNKLGTIEEIVQIEDTVIDEINDENEAEEQVNYSFLKKFEELEEKFNHDFDGVPSRFFNTDLRGSKLMSLSYRDKDVNDIITGFDNKDVYVDHRELGTRMCLSMADKSALIMSEEDFKEVAGKLGISNIEPLTNERRLRGLKMSRAWRGTIDTVKENGELETVTLLIGDKQTKELAGYHWKASHNPPFKDYESFRQTDLRTLAGAVRLQNKTGVNMVKVMAGDARGASRESKRKTLEVLGQLEDAQLEGKNFISQRKYIRESGKTVASAWQDKKYPDKTHIAMMKNSVLNNHFSQIEVDNSVDPQEFADFEKAYLETKSLLPQIPKGLEPKLRCRKLGKHNASGLFAAVNNSVMIDVNTSGSFIHEMAHQYDIVVKNNKSLSKDFNNIVKEYSKNFTLPPNLPNSKIDYYCSAHEILARSMEKYAQEKLGINNRLLDTTKLNNFDYQPFNNNPELKQKAFDFIEKNFYN